MGHLFSKNEERGVFKTTDGGQHWKKVLYVNDGVGAIDLVINRKTPTHALRRDVRQGPQAVADRRERSGERRLQERGRRREVDQARRRIADGQDRPHRARHVSEESADSVRAAGEPESCERCARSAGARRRPWGRGRRARVARGCRSSRRGRRRERDGAARAGHHRQRALSQRRRRQDVDEDVADQRRGRQGAVLVQPDQDRSEQRSGRHRKQRQHVHHARRRQDVADRILPRRVRRLPLHVVGSGRLRSHHPRQRRRRAVVERRRQDDRLRAEPARRRGLRDRRGHGRSVQRLRRPAGSRLVEGPEQRPDRHHHASKTG